MTRVPRFQVASDSANPTAAALGGSACRRGNDHFEQLHGWLASERDFGDATVRRRYRRTGNGQSPEQGRQPRAWSDFKQTHIVNFTEQPGVDEHPAEGNPASPDRHRRRPIDLRQIDAHDAVLNEVPLGRQEKNLPRIPGILAVGGPQIASSGDNPEPERGSVMGLHRHRHVPRVIEEGPGRLWDLPAIDASERGETRPWVRKQANQFEGPRHGTLAPMPLRRG